MFFKKIRKPEKEIFDKLNFFGEDSDLEISEHDQALLEDLTIMEVDIFEAIKRLAYSKMTFYARRVIRARPEDVAGLQSRILAIDDLIKTISNIKSYKATKEDEAQPLLRNADSMLKKMLGIKDENVASRKKEKYTIDDYMESKDFKGGIIEHLK